MIKNTNEIYKDILVEIYLEGDIIETRNHRTMSSIFVKPVTFTSTPLVTLRKTAWKKALREMEWFMSGVDTCPEELLDWWNSQLNEEGRLVQGYGTQFRSSTYEHLDYYGARYFDQIAYILTGLRNNPSSRRLILTSWNPGEMARITETNRNINTPTCCHNTCTQFFVRTNAIHVKTYQRSVH